MSRCLIINADDFGLASCVNRAVVESYCAGILTSTSLMANGPAFEEAADAAKAHPALGVGVHLNIVRGRPLIDLDDAAPLLVDGERFGLGRMAMRQRIGRPGVLAVVEQEWRAQIERVLNAGITPTHLDWEKHCGLWGPLSTLTSRLAVEYGMGAVRNLREPVAFCARRLPWPGIGAIARAAVLRCMVDMSFCTSGVAQPDCFLGQAHIGRVNGAFLQTLAKVAPDCVCELMTHPATPDLEGLDLAVAEMGPSWINQMRAGEFAALTDPTVAEAFAASDVKLINFAAL